MSSLLQTLQALSSQRGATGAGTDLSSAQPRQGQDGQAFSSLMNQFRDAQPSSAQAQAKVASPDAGARARTADRTADRTAQNLAAQRQAAARREAIEARPASGAQTKAPVKAAQPKTPQAPKEQTAEKVSSEESKTSDESSNDGAKEVAFTTEHGQALAWVKELKLPADVPSDPAAMLAWLSALPKGNTPGLEASELAGDAAMGIDGRGAGGPAAAGWSVHAMQNDQGSDLSQGFGAPDGGLSLEDLGLGLASGETGQDDASPLQFSAMMARETARTGGPGSAESARHHTGSLSTPVDSPEFPQALAHRVGLWVSGPAANGPMTAELRMNPEEMGPVQIRIVLDGQKAQIDFAAAHVETRQAIEASLPALSSQLEEAGLSLSGGGVSDQQAGQSWRGDQGAERADGWGRGQGASSGRDGVSGERMTDQSALGTQLAARAAAASRAGGLDLYA